MTERSYASPECLNQANQLKKKGYVMTHEEQLDMLSRRIAQEGDSRVKGFKAKIASMLQPYAIGLNDTRDMDMTVDLGISMRIQLKQVLKILKSQGIDINI